MRKAPWSEMMCQFLVGVYSLYRWSLEQSSVRDVEISFGHIKAPSVQRSIEQRDTQRRKHMI